MKIVIHSPLVPESAIGAAATLVGDELARLGHHVVYVDSAERHGSSAREGALSWGDVAGVELAHQGADAIVYHVGNHFPYHQGGLWWLDRAPGIVVVHDYFLGHLFYGWMQQADPEEIELALRTFAGIGRAEFESMAAQGRFLEEASARAPMVEWVVARATGVAVHSAWGLDRVTAWAPGPVRRISLAYDPKQVRSPSPSKRPGRIRLLTFGHINPNKLAHEVIEAIGSDLDLAARIEYRLGGPIDDAYRRELERRSSELGISVTFLGPVTDDELAREIADADVVSCLRWPALESASASAIEAFKSGKATMVVDVGFYAELPSDIVVKVSPGSIRDDLVLALTALADSAALRRELGERARDFADYEFSDRYYAQQLVELIHTVRAWAPVRSTISDAASALVAWGYRGDPRIAERLTGPLAIFTPAPAAG